MDKEKLNNSNVIRNISTDQTEILQVSVVSTMTEEV